MTVSFRSWCIVLLVYCSLGVLFSWCIVLLVYCSLGVLFSWCIVLLVYCSLGVFSTSFLCSHSLVLNNLAELPQVCDDVILPGRHRH